MNDKDKHATAIEFKGDTSKSFMDIEISDKKDSFKITIDRSKIKNNEDFSLTVVYGDEYKPNAFNK